jgi:acyl-CoA thioesterase
MSFASATAVQRIEPGRYSATVAEGWDIAGNANGGYLLAILARSVAAETGKPDPVTITGHYLAPARPGPVTVNVGVRRAGKRHATAVADLIAGDRTCLTALVTTTDLADSSGPERIDAVPPPLPPPDECVPVEPSATFPPPFMGRVELRLHPDDAAFALGRPSGRAEMRGWLRLRDGEPLDSIGLVLATDAFPPTVFNADLPVAWTPTVELTAHVRALPATGWVRCAFATRFISGGYLEADGVLWDAQDRLVAESRQLALVPRA